MNESDNVLRVRRERTAIHRPNLSRPLQQAIEDGLISAATSVFDYGCGFGDDVRFLRSMNISACGWDPASFPENTKQPAEIVNVGYVVNVIEDPSERLAVLVDAWRYTTGVLIVSARLSEEALSARWLPYSDGILTARGTFQKFFYPR